MTDKYKLATPEDDKPNECKCCSRAIEEQQEFCNPKCYEDYTNE